MKTVCKVQLKFYLSTIREAISHWNARSRTFYVCRIPPSNLSLPFLSVSLFVIYIFFLGLFPYFLFGFSFFSYFPSLSLCLSVFLIFSQQPLRVCFSYFCSLYFCFRLSIPLSNTSAITEACTSHHITLHINSLFFLKVQIRKITKTSNLLKSFNLLLIS